MPRAACCTHSEPHSLVGSGRNRPGGLRRVTLGAVPGPACVGVVGRCVPPGAGFWARPPPLCVSVQHAAQMEQKQNDTENKKVHGDVVKYGSVIQV